MATVETRAAHDVADQPGGVVYDAFISYSHAADGLLAPRLQAGLQRFAKPWWKRRALRMFRDEASLAANPHLWSSITEALDSSSWFVLLLSPEAARSEWVNREVEYWLDHKDPDRIVPVLTEGEFSWSDGDVAGDVPAALYGVFPDEPRWVDLRFARSEEQLDLNNAAFRGAVADIAAPLRGVPKDELESEEVRQHRRTIRTAWAGVAALLVLAIAAGGIAFYAVGQRNAAQDLARQVIDYTRQIAIGGATPPDEFVDADLQTLPVPVREAVPETPRLDFLQVFCREGACHRDARFVPVDVLADQPFHIRHGFPAAGADREGTFEPGFGLNVYITRLSGPDSRFELDTTYRFTADYVVTVTSNRCGPDYADQNEPQVCDVFVHDFPQGLPAGRYDIWVEWLAPCRWWAVASVCEDPDEVLSLFASSVNNGWYSDTWTEDDDMLEVFG